MPDKDKMFSTEQMRAGLKERSIRSAGITVFAQGVKLVITLTSIAILARLLEPSDYGLVVMVTIFTGVSTYVLDGGLSMVTIQRNKITNAQVSNLFWINCLIGVVLCAVGISLAPLVAALYGEPRLIGIMIVVSSTFIIASLSMQHDAILRRQMRFKVISVIDTLALAVGVAAAITAALAGLGYWALLVNAIATATAATIMRWMATGWIPSRPCRGSDMKPLIDFGLNLTGAGVVGYFTANITSFSIGYIGGTQSLGEFNRANTLASLPISQVLSPVMNVIQPALARIASDEEKFRGAIISLAGKIVLVTMFVALVMGLLADWIVLVLLGDSWVNAVPMLRLLAIFSAVEPIAALLSVALVAYGRARPIFKWKMLSLLILLGALAIGSTWGVYGIIFAYALSGAIIRLPLFLYFASKHLPISFLELLRPLCIPIACAAITGAIAASARSFGAVESAGVGLVVYSIAILVVYVFLLMMAPSSRKDIMQFAGQAKL